MDNFEKVEKLVAKAGVSYEEAKRALEAANGDLLDAMILLEREGKAEAPKKSSYSTQYEDLSGYLPVEKASAAKTESGKSAGDGWNNFKELCGKIWHALSTNYLLVERRGERFLKLPLWILILLVLASWGLVFVLFVVSLFFGFTYRFAGEADMKTANEVMEKVSDTAEKIRDEVRKM